MIDASKEPECTEGARWKESYSAELFSLFGEKTVYQYYECVCGKKLEVGSVGVGDICDESDFIYINRDGFSKFPNSLLDWMGYIPSEDDIECITEKATIIKTFSGSKIFSPSIYDWIEKCPLAGGGGDATPAPQQGNVSPKQGCTKTMVEFRVHNGPIEIGAGVMIGRVFHYYSTDYLQGMLCPVPERLYEGKPTLATSRECNIYVNGNPVEVDCSLEPDYSYDYPTVDFNPYNLLLIDGEKRDPYQSNSEDIKN